MKLGEVVGLREKLHYINNQNSWHKLSEYTSLHEYP